MYSPSPSSSGLSSPPPSDDEPFEFIELVSAQKEAAAVRSPSHLRLRSPSPAPRPAAIDQPAPLPEFTVAAGEPLVSEPAATAVSPTPPANPPPVPSKDAPSITVGSNEAPSAVPAKRHASPVVNGNGKAVNKIIKKVSKPVVKRRKKQWEAPFVYTSTNSPLVKKNIDLRDMLCNPLAWDGLSREAQQSLIPLFPPGFVLHAGTDRARPDTEALKNSDDFRHDCAQYVNNISLGRHDPDWILQAQEAHELRAAGFFDEFLRKRFYDDFGVEPPPGYPEPSRMLKDGEEGDGGNKEEGGNMEAGGKPDEIIATDAAAPPPSDEKVQQESQETGKEAKGDETEVRVALRA